MNSDALVLKPEYSGLNNYKSADADNHAIVF